MKCIKAIQASKDVELGEIRRVDDKTANTLVGKRWVYISKSEWKSVTRVLKEENQTQSENKKVKEKKSNKKNKKN